MDFDSTHLTTSSKMFSRFNLLLTISNTVKVKLKMVFQFEVLSD